MDNFSISIKLLMFAVLPAAASVFFYLLEKKTAFKKLPYYARQIIIGVGFGLLAILGTEKGVNLGAATANARDAAPLCAGLFFGGPAGIIAGLIGGIERWFAVMWGAGMYSRVACTASTIFAGFYAAGLRRHLFDNKYPSWGMALFTGAVMEVIHLTVLFLTHLNDAQTAFEIVKICTIPMISANAIGVMMTSVVIGLISGSFKAKRSGHRRLSQMVQSWLLVTVILSYFASTIFVYSLETSTAMYSATGMMDLYISDVKAEIKASSDNNILKLTRQIATDFNEGKAGYDDLEKLCDTYNVSEINIIDAHGIITHSTVSDFVGFDMRSGDQSAEFMVLISSPVREYVQEFRPATFVGSSGAESKKYAGVVLDRGGFVQIGYNGEKFQADIAESVKNLTRNRHVGADGYMLIAASDFSIVSSLEYTNGALLNKTGIELDPSTHEQNTVYSGTVFGKPSYWMFSETEGYYIVAVMGEDEVFETRDTINYVNSYMEVLIFALMFLIIYLLIKRLVVDNIRSVNTSLSRIISGDLDVKVSVRSSDEFSSLSDDINSTVTTLKHYIDEAAARIDAELEFAKKIQFSTLPSTFPAYPNNKEFDIYATMHTAKEVGGDFYDFYMIGENKLAFTIADVSGKGIPAAMFMMTSKTILKGLAESGLPVNEVLTQANEKLCAENEAGMFVTVWMGILDIDTGHVSYSCAGHNPPLVYRTGKGYEYLKMRPGFVLAGMEGVRYKLSEMYLNPGDKLFLYTDGVTEATDVGKNLFGEERLLELLNSKVELSASETLSETKKSIDGFVGEAEQFDDITMVCVDYFGKDYELIAEKSFPASDAALADATAFVEETLDAVGCSMKASMQISVALEEIFVNIAHYAYKDTEGDGKVLISLLDDDDSIRIRFTDSGVKFDPLAKADPDVTLSADERSIGGLGIYMVKKTMDGVEYQYRDGKNIFTMIKKIR